MYERVQNTYSTITLGMPANCYFSRKKDEETVTSKIDNDSAGPESLRKSFGWVLNLEVCVT